jgi:hypothetical protein
MQAPIWSARCGKRTPWPQTAGCSPARTRCTQSARRQQGVQACTKACISADDLALPAKACPALYSTLPHSSLHRQHALVSLVLPGGMCCRQWVGKACRQAHNPHTCSCRSSSSGDNCATPSPSCGSNSACVSESPASDFTVKALLGESMWTLTFDADGGLRILAACTSTPSLDCCCLDSNGERAKGVCELLRSS